MTTVKERFLRNVNRGSGDECWTYGRNKSYGRIRLGGKGSKHIAAHRLSYFIAFGFMPTKHLVVMHKCDNPRCVNPNHLCLGTFKDNTYDALAKGRLRRQFKPGPDAQRGKGNTRLTQAQVSAIRKDTRIARLVASEMGVCVSTIHKIRNGTLWR